MSKRMIKPAKTAHLESRSIIRLSGRDRLAFLQGLVSQDVRLAEAEKPFFTALLTPQGKYLFDFFVIPSGDTLLLDCESDQATELIKRLSFFRMRADIHIENLRGLYSIYAAWGGVFNQPSAFVDPRHESLGVRLVSSAMEAHNFSATHDESDYRRHRIKNGVAEGAHEIEPGQATLLEINFDHLNAISWSKGCYIGQELTARTHYRGLIKRRLLPFHFEGIAPEKHSVIHDEAGLALGDVKALEDDYGIGLWHLEKIRPYVMDGRALVHHGTLFRVSLPPFLTEKIFG